MSEQDRPKPTTVCDLCDEEIDKAEPGESGSLTHGFVARKVELPRTRWVFLHWPPASRRRRWEDKQKSENRERTFDFHADCILRLIEGAIVTRKDQT